MRLLVPLILAFLVTETQSRLEESRRLAEAEDVDKLEWWRKTNFYHIYIRSFRDSDGDGQGDLGGVIEKLDYLQAIGVETLLLSPFYSSPMKDGGYDIDDYFAINPRFGSMRDLELLLAGLKARGMRLVVDFVPNHTSNKHQWFQCSERALIEPARCAKYEHYYVWSNSTSRPTNWLSIFNNGESAWSWSEVRNQYYYHQFLPQQPDLNYRNPLVVEEMKEVARFWLAKGVDGLRVDAVLYLHEQMEPLRDEPPNEHFNRSDPNKYESLLHIYTKSLKESARQVRDWQEVASEFPGDRVIITEAYESIPKVIEYYGPSPEQPYANMPFNFDLLQLFQNTNFRPLVVENYLAEWMEAVRALDWPRRSGALQPWSLYVTGNHDTSRAANRYGEQNLQLFKWIAYLMPASPVDYYGDELAIRDSNFSSIPEKTVQEGETTRLVFRAPMAWSAEEPSGGFSTSGDIWMPLNQNYKTNNVARLMRDRNEKNSLNNFISLQSIRRNYIKSILFGDLIFYRNNPRMSSSVFSLAREHDRGEKLMILANFNGQLSQSVELIPRRSLLDRRIRAPPKRARVLLTNFNSNHLKEGHLIHLNQSLKLAPYQSAILGY